jgi:transcriptional regulator with XRE-family HTH domain
MAHPLVGSKIRERRQALKIQQGILASKAGISPSYLNLIEHNKRTIAGKPLNLIAEALDLLPSELTQEIDDSLLDSLKSAAAQFSNSHAEIDRLTEFASRFPGWSTLIGYLSQHVEQQSESLTVLSDRLSYDPFFRDTTFAILSHITALRSTSAILSQNPDMPELQRTRFISNMDSESRKLASSADELVAYLDQAEEKKEGKKRASVVQDLVETNEYFLPELEDPENDSLTNLPHKQTSNSFEKQQLEAFVDRYRSAATNLPFAEIISFGRENGFDPQGIAQEFSCDLKDVFFRLAHLPVSEDVPNFGIIECDGSGGVLYRKETKELHLPRHGSACPLWPLFKALQTPAQPLRAFVETPNRTRLITFSVSRNQVSQTYGLPGSITSTMIFTADKSAFPNARSTPLVPTVEIGSNCSVCPRSNCASRRSPQLIT